MVGEVISNREASSNILTVRIPELIEVVGQIPLEVRERFVVHARGALVCLHPLIGVPHHPFGNRERLCCRHWFLPSLVDQHES
jgi:hypothetical protein